MDYRKQNSRQHKSPTHPSAEQIGKMRWIQLLPVQGKHDQQQRGCTHDDVPIMLQSECRTQQNQKGQTDCPYPLRGLRISEQIIQQD